MAAGVSWLRVSVCSAPMRKGRSPCPGHTRVPGLLQRESTILRSPGKAGCRTYRCAVLHWRGRPFFKNIREEVQALAKAQTLDTEGERKEVSLSGRHPCASVLRRCAPRTCRRRPCCDLCPAPLLEPQPPPLLVYARLTQAPLPGGSWERMLGKSALRSHVTKTSLPCFCTEGLSRA